MLRTLILIAICITLCNSIAASASPPVNAIKEKSMTHRPDCITKLSQAKSFDDGVQGESNTPSPNHAAYAEASGMIQGIESSDLQWLLANGSPAGRIYGAILMKESSRFGNDDSFGKLIKDTSKVTFRSGCESFQTTVGEVCRKFISDGHYLGFKFSMFCKLKAPVNE